MAVSVVSAVKAILPNECLNYEKNWGSPPQFFLHKLFENLVCSLGGERCNIRELHVDRNLVLAMYDAQVNLSPKRKASDEGSSRIPDVITYRGYRVIPANFGSPTVLVTFWNPKEIQEFEWMKSDLMKETMFAIIEEVLVKTKGAL